MLEEESSKTSDSASKISTYKLFKSIDEELKGHWEETKVKSIKDIAKNQNQSEIAPKETSPEEKKQFPDEPVTYYGNIEGVVVKLIVNFNNKTVSGSISEDDGVWYIDAPIVEGVIDNMDTLSITTLFEGVIGNKEAGRSEPVCGFVYGNISKDLSEFDGTLLETTEGISIVFTATR